MKTIRTILDFHSHLNRAIYNPAGEGLQIDFSRVDFGFTGADIVDAPVERALDFTILNDAPVKEKLLMRTDVTGGEECAVEVIDGDRLIINPDLNCGVWRDLVCIGDGEISSWHLPYPCGTILAESDSTPIQRTGTFGTTGLSK